MCASVSVHCPEVDQDAPNHSLVRMFHEAPHRTQMTIYRSKVYAGEHKSNEPTHPLQAIATSRDETKRHQKQHDNKTAPQELHWMSTPLFSAKRMRNFVPRHPMFEGRHDSTKGPLIKMHSRLGAMSTVGAQRVLPQQSCSSCSRATDCIPKTSVL